jgi:hypothetical protein
VPVRTVVAFYDRAFFLEINEIRAVIDGVNELVDEFGASGIPLLAKVL